MARYFRTSKVTVHFLPAVSEVGKQLAEAIMATQVQAYILGLHELPEDCPYSVGDGTVGTVAVKEGRDWALFSMEAFNEEFEWV